MALIIEDGSIVDNANSYATVSGANDYFDELADTRWTIGPTDANKEAAILKGMRYLEALDWKGTTVSGVQPLQFPRTDLTDRDGRAVDDDVVPTKVVQALYEAAVRSLGGPAPLQPDLERGGRVSAEQVGSISRAYSRGAPASSIITTVRDLLKGYLKSSTNPTIVRA